MTDPYNNLGAMDPNVGTTVPDMVRHAPTKPVRWYNAVKCVGCGEVVESRYRHDFVSHSCAPGIYFFVDGGSAYLRRGWGNDLTAGSRPEDHYTEMGHEIKERELWPCSIPPGYPWS